MKIGLSLSFCIGDMVAVRVDPAEVRKIIAATAASTPEGWERTIALYREWFWYLDPDRGEALCRQFLAEGKIEQPRLAGVEVYDITQSHWRCETPYGEVAWQPDRHYNNMDLTG